MPESSLIKDLGVESLDLIDINFRLEQDFNIVMPRKYLLGPRGGALSGRGRRSTNRIDSPARP